MFKLRHRNIGDKCAELLNSKYELLAYAYPMSKDIRLAVDFPTEWHENPRAWLRVSLWFFAFGVSVPWPWLSKDYQQCSGPTYGFSFYEEYFWLYYGQAKGYHTDPTLTIKMPWGWNFIACETLTAEETHDYRYPLRDGTIQDRKATIKKVRRTWARNWFPSKRVEDAIDIEFSDEVGERSGSWKGGVLGCGYGMLPGETPLDALRRMEKERKF